jgi:hypothetical protein
LLQETFRKPNGKSFHVIFHVTSITSYCNYVKRLVPHCPSAKQATALICPCLSRQGVLRAGLIKRIVLYVVLHVRYKDMGSVMIIPQAARYG